MKRTKETRTDKVLAADLKEVTDKYLRAQREALEILMDAPSGIPLPDGQYRIAKQMSYVKRAFSEYQAALKRYKDFVEHGIVPDDPEEPGR